MTTTDAKKKKNLGRGLSALLGEEKPQPVAVVEDGDAPKAANVIPIDTLKPSRFQPRRDFNEETLEDLVTSIREKGILQPILVRPDPQATGRFEIIAGERRWRAAQRAQLHQVPVVVKSFSDQEALEVALVENLQRQDLNPLEEAQGYARLMEEFEHTQEDLARAVGKSRSHVANMIRLLGLPEPVKVMVEDGRLSAGHARALLGAESPLDLADHVVKKGLNVRQTERLAKKDGAVTSRRPRAAKGSEKDADTLALERDLSNLLGLKVTITPKGSGGEFVIEYDTLEQLDDILNRLSRSDHGDSRAA